MPNRASDDLVWDEPEDAGPATLSRADVVAAALALADAEGLEAVSIRRVAAELGVRPMALYTHIASKDDLVALMLHEMSGELLVPEPLPDDWREALQFGFATRVPKAYPMYDMEYSNRVDTIKSWLAPIENLQQVGRNGLHRYNNSDHSMLTAMRAVDNLLLGTDHDIWAVNAESVYHEEDTAQDSEQPYISAPETPAQREPLER